MVNERLTETLVRNRLREKGYDKEDNILIEEQASANPKIDKLLKNASKAGSGKGYPDFIISFKDKPEDLLLIECKGSTAQHESKDRQQYKDYAVDGVLLYAAHLKEAFNVLALAISGQNEREQKISTFLWLRHHHIYKALQDKDLRRPREVRDVVVQASKPITENELIKKAIAYNHWLHQYSIPEKERCTLISAILIALQDRPFLESYQVYGKNKDLIENLLDACQRVLEKNELDEAKARVIIGEYAQFNHNITFSKATLPNRSNKKDEKNTLLRDFITTIREEVLPYIHESAFDVLGKFYTQFIRHAGGDQKTGLVLTPQHITDFFCAVTALDEGDIVFDPCCGTAGFLVAAMNHMLKKAGHNTDKQKVIKSSQLLGIEKRADMFAHACSNMMMRGDGKSHILHGDCFDKKNKAWLQARKPTKAFLNPPYQGGNADEQLEFVENALECLGKEGLCVAICQISVAVSSKKAVLAVRERLLAHHTLEGVFSMPTDLFHPIGVNTSILILRAHHPHPKGKKTFFGYFKEDGFVKQKHQGRVDKENRWSAIKKKWVAAYMNRETRPGLSVMQEVTAQDEWCAEAYMETDYATLTQEDFIQTLKNYVAFQFLNDD